MRNNTAVEEILKYFNVTDGKLTVAGQPLAVYADRTLTPFYIYDLGVAKKKYLKLRNALPSKIDIHYAIKANPHPEIIQFFNFLGTGFDVASAGELSKAVACGAAPNKIGFAGPGKRPSEIEYACKLGIECLSAESEYELDVANQIAGALNKKLNIILRINPKYESVGSGMKMGGGAKQFGIDQEIIPKILRRFNSWHKLNFIGFHIFAGSQNLYEDSICMAFTQAIETIIELIPDCPQYPQYVNLGGGFGIPYYGNDKEIDIKKVGLHIKEELNRYNQEFNNVKIVVETGRYLIGESGIYIARVLYKKESRGETFLVLDGGMNHHLAASGNLGQILKKNFPIGIPEKINAEHLETVNIVGPLCTPIDRLASKATLPVAEVGDFVAIFSSGAYGYSASPLNFLSHPEPAEIIVKY